MENPSSWLGGTNSFWEETAALNAKETEADPVGAGMWEDEEGCLLHTRQPHLPVPPACG